MKLNNLVSHKGLIIWALLIFSLLNISPGYAADFTFNGISHTALTSPTGNVKEGSSSNWASEGAAPLAAEDPVEKTIKLVKTYGDPDNFYEGDELFYDVVISTKELSGRPKVEVVEGESNIVDTYLENTGEPLYPFSMTVRALKAGHVKLKVSAAPDPSIFTELELRVRGNDELGFQINDFSIEVGRSVEIPVNVPHNKSMADFSYNGFQFDIALPEGVSISEVKANTGLTGFQVYKNEIEGSKTRIMVIDPNNLSSSSVFDEVLTLTFEAAPNAKAKEATAYSITNAVFFVNQTQGEEIKGVDSEYKITIVNVPITEEDVTVTPAPRDDNDQLPEGDENKRAGNEIYVDEVLTYTAAVAKAVTYPSLKWTLAEGSEYISIRDNGQNSVEVTGLKIGEGKIKATSEAYPDFSMEYTVKVIPMPIKGVTLSAEGGEDLTAIPAGSELQLKAIVEPAQKYTGEVEINWSSNASDVAEVGNEQGSKGLVQALKIGTATITAAAGHAEASAKERYKTPKSGDAEINVIAAELESVEVAAEGPTALKAGESVQLKATVTPGEAATGPVEIAWVSSAPEIISVSSEGEATALKYDANPVTVTATVVKTADKDKADAKTVEGSIVLTLETTDAESITITTLSMEGRTDKTDLKQTEELTLTAAVVPETATNKEIEWTVSHDGHIDIELHPDDRGDETLYIAKVREDVVQENVTITATVKGTGVSSSITVNIAELIPGDADDDLTVDVGDVITIAHWMVDDKADNFCFVNADITKTKGITLTDLTESIDIALHWGDPGYSKALTRTSAETLRNGDSLTADITNDREKDICTVGLRISSRMDYKALQAEIDLPEGCVAADVTPGPKAENHSIIFNCSDEGKLKIVVFSMNNALFKGGDDMLLNIRCKGMCGKAEDLDITNIRAIGNDGEEYMLGFDGAAITGEAGLGMNYYRPEENLEIYNLQGIKIRNTENLVPGIYIVNGKKIFVSE